MTVVNDCCQDNVEADLDNDRYTEMHGDLLANKNLDDEDHYDMFKEGDDSNYIHADDHYDVHVDEVDHYEDCENVSKSRQFDCQGTKDASDEFHTFKDF